MPPRVYLKGPSYVLRPAGGGSIRLCSSSAKQSDVWQAYELLINEDLQGYKVSRLVADFFASADFIDLSPTYRDWETDRKSVV